MLTVVVKRVSLSFQESCFSITRECISYFSKEGHLCRIEIFTLTQDVLLAEQQPDKFY
jgi:hypothetical protein